MTKTKNHAKKRLAKNQPPRPHQKIAFIEHVHELRKRLFYVATSVGIFSILAYCIEHRIIAILLKPARDQEFIYTSPGGGIDFLFRVCLYTGIACSIPVIIYQVLRYLEPLIKDATKRMVLWGSLASGILAIAGIVFGYFLGLPSGLDFLLNQFHTSQITALITIQSYMSFVMMYLLGSAMLLQVPLILLFINRIKPLKPSKLLSLSYQRWVILFAFISSAIINASPQIMAQLMVAGPVILSYEIGVGIIWYVNRHRPAPDAIRTLRDNDEALRAQRQARAANSKTVPYIPVVPAPAANMTPQRHVIRRQSHPAALPFAPSTISKGTPNKAVKPHTTASLQAGLAQNPTQPTSHQQPPARTINSFAPRTRYQFTPAQRLVQ